MLRPFALLLLLLACCRAEVVSFSGATATFQQDAQLTIARAIDGNANDGLGWAVLGGHLVPQSAIFQAASPVQAGVLQFKLFHNWGGAHLINEFRLSVTADPNPSSAGNWTPLSPISAQSTGTILSLVHERLRSTGNPGTATYTVQATAPFPHITAFRLEVFPFDFKTGDSLGATLGRGATGNFILSEFAVESDPGTTGNIALLQPVTASGDLVAGHPASVLVDGKASTYTHPSSNIVSLGFFYELDLGRVWELDRLVLLNRADCCSERLTHYEVQLYDSEADDPGPGSMLWRAVLRADGSVAGDGGADVITASSGTGSFRGRYLRIINRSNAARNPQIAEIEVYGSLRPSIPSFVITGNDVIPSGHSTTLSWSASNVGHVTLSPGLGVQPASGTITVSPTTTTTYTLTAGAGAYAVSATVTVGVDVTLSPPRIVEVSADQDALSDDDGDTPDWIELWNPNPFRLHLAGYRLSDGGAPWMLPDLPLAPGARLIIFASGKNRADPAHPLHASFALAKNGETLTLRHPAGSLLQTFTFPALEENISYGFASNGSSTGFFKPSTPGAPNGAITYSGLTGRTFASVSRGYFDTPFDVTLATETPGAQIRYTLDGSTPAAGNGVIYSAPIRIATTSTLRAAAFVPDWAPGDVITHTYLFPAAVLAQPVAPPGFPTSWTDAGDWFAADYEMDPDVVNHPTYHGQMPAALKSIRSLSVVMDPADLFGPNGLYMNPQQRGIAWERATSIELLLPPDGSHPHGRSGFQENCGLRIFGYGWRAHNSSRKHSFRLKFKAAYDGPRKLEYPLFPGWPVTKFDNLVLRAQGSRSWNDFRVQDIRQTQYLHDAFARDTALAMGKDDAPATYVHLYLNGLYWGLYNIVPRPDASFAEEHYGGQDSDYDALNSRLGNIEVVDGNEDAWSQVQVLAQLGLAHSTNYAQLQQLVDLDNLIDYVIFNLWATNHDGPVNQNNFRAVRKRAPDGRWRFFLWDMEYTLWDADENTFANFATVGRTAWPLFDELRKNPDFRLRFADRLHRHCFNDGALTPAAAIARWNARADEIYTAILAESARWGDVRRLQPYTRDIEWAAERTRLTTEYFPQRTTYFITHAQAANLYPTVAAPVFSRYGGAVAAGYSLTLSAPAGTIYYTLDGTDPRAVGGSPAGTAYAEPLVLYDGAYTVRARTFSAGAWSALSEAVFTTTITPIAEARLVFSEVHYRPAGETAEFIEIMNVGATVVDLAGCHFTRGIEFTFPAPTYLAPGGRVVVRGFEFAGDLSDSGETITLTQPDGVSVLAELTYGTGAPWPEPAEDAGLSLTLLHPRDHLDLDQPANWRLSLIPGGTPGTTDAVSFTGDPLADFDGDGLCALVEYALGTSDLSAEPLPASTSVVDGLLHVTFPLRPAADDVIRQVEFSTNLIDWKSSQTLIQPVSQTPSSTTWRAIFPTPRQYFRLRVEQRP